MIKAGWFVITGSYFVTLLITSMTYTAVTNLPIDHHRDISGLIIGTVMVIIPYIIGGIFAGISQKTATERAAFWMSIVPAISEKILIFLLGALFVAGGGDGGGDKIVNWDNVMLFVSAEAIPYFTNSYLLTFPLSVLISVATAKCLVAIKKSKD